MAKKIKFSFIRFLYAYFSFLADKTGGWKIFVQPKIILGTALILSANAVAQKPVNNQKNNTTILNEITIVVDPNKVMCYYAGPPIKDNNNPFVPIQLNKDSVLKELSVLLKQDKKPFHLASRERADTVLAMFDYIKEAKLLFSINNSYFYIIIDDPVNYKEVYVFFRNNKINRIHFIKNKYGIIKTKYEKELLYYRKNHLSKTNPFNFEQYHSGFLTDINAATAYLGHNYGQPAYFVVKDKYGNRYGEVGLYSFVFGKNMDRNLIWYLNMRLGTEMFKKRK